MKSKKGLIVLIISCFLFAISFVYAQPQDVYELKLEGAKFPPVQFSHAKHTTNYKINCKACHHMEKCTQCHGITEGKVSSKAMDAYHKNCIECHKKEAETGKAAPTKCNECHKKS